MLKYPVLKLNKHILSTTLVLLLGYGITLGFSNVYYQHSQSSKSQTKSSQYLSASSIDLFYLGSQSEYLSLAENITQGGQSHDAAKQVIGYLKDYNIGIKSLFKQNECLILNLRIRLKKTNLLFPFHFFW
ncbi:MAG TPA: hypothetical protein PKL31_11175 [Fulvivirga sp.]|nr:hypothetical protein [Fulvivirga sp.]